MTMTKDEMLTALNEGKKVTHRYFTDEEWMMLIDPIDNIYLFEDGVKIPAHEFWANRRDMDWMEDWEIFK